MSTQLREKLFKTEARVVRQARGVALHMTEVAVPRELFVAILDRIDRFAVSPPLALRG